MGKVVLILAVAAAGLGLTSLHLVKQVRERDAAVAKLQTQVAGLQEQAAAARAAPAPAPVVAQRAPEQRGVFTVVPKQVSTASAVQTIGGAQVPPPPSREERIRMMREHREQQRQLMQDPEYREAMRVQSRGNLVRQYPGLVKELGLDQQQAEDFFAMLADQQLRAAELMDPLWNPEDGENRDQAALQERHRKLQQATTEMQRKNEAELAARFGQDKLQAWQEYQATMGQRYQLEHMRNTLSAQGIPLNEDASKPMLKALAAAQKAEMDEYTAAANRRGAAPEWAARGFSSVVFDSGRTEQQIEMSKKRNQRTLDAVSPYLTFEQRAALEKEQDAQLKMLEAQLRIMRARGNTNTNGDVNFVENSVQLIAVP